MTPNYQRASRAAHIRVFNLAVADYTQDRHGDIVTAAFQDINAGRAADVLEWLPRRMPLWRQSDVGLQLMGTAHKYLSKWAEGRTLLQAARRLRQAMRDAHPDDNGLREDLSVTIIGLADIESGDGNDVLAVDLLIEASRVAPGFLVPYFNRLCIASSARDVATMLRIVEELERDAPAFYTDSIFQTRLQQDGELYNARKEPEVWSRLVNPTFFTQEN